MRITFSEARAGDVLVEDVRRNDCLVEHIGADVLDVSPRQALLEHAAKLEIEGLLRVWCKLHPELSVTASTLERTHAASESDTLSK
jgi:hypothetical protein